MDSSAVADSQRSSPLSDADDGTAGSQDQGKRQSRRARRKPELFSSQSYSNPAKRKRTASRREGEEDDDDDAPESATEPENNEDEPQEDDTDNGEGEPDEEELKERKRAARRRSKAKTGESKKSKSRHAPKKPKIANGVTTELTLRPVANGQRPAAKKRKAPPRPSGLGTDEDGLFGKSSLAQHYNRLVGRV
jgi:cohesin complex subunit SA-1/2